MSVESNSIWATILTIVTILMVFAFDGKLADARRELFDRDNKLKELEAKLLELEERIRTLNSED